MNTIVYLVYGGRREYQLELTYSVLSALHWAGDQRSKFHIALVTDEASRRPDLPVENIVIPPAEFEIWSRGGQYQHQAKVHAFMKALDLFKGKVALIDTDTYFLRDPLALFDRIAPGSSVMHAFEGTLGSDRLLGPLLGKLENGSSVDPILRAYPISPATRLFNSGVIGLDYADRAVVDDVLPLLEEFYRILPAFNIEQFAFSVALDRRTSLTDGAELIRHYYGHERGFIRARIAELFPIFTSDLLRRYVPRLPAVGGFAKKRLIDRIRARLKAALRGEGSEYRFAYLAYLSALSNAYRSPTLANIWALIAVVVLRQNEFGIAEVEEDFPLMGRPDACFWANSDTRQAWTLIWREFEQARARGRTKTPASAWSVR